MKSNTDADVFPLADQIVTGTYGPRESLGAADFHVLQQILANDASGWRHPLNAADGALRAVLVAAGVCRELRAGPALILLPAGDAEADAALWREAGLHGLLVGTDLLVHAVLTGDGEIGDGFGQVVADALASPAPAFAAVFLPAHGGEPEQAGSVIGAMLRELIGQSAIIWVRGRVVDTELEQAVDSELEHALDALETAGLVPSGDDDGDEPVWDVDGPAAVRPPPVVESEPGAPGRGADAREVVAHLLTAEPAVMIVVARPGIGGADFLGDVAAVWARAGRGRLRRICVGTCDPGGGLDTQLGLIDVADIAVIEDVDRGRHGGGGPADLANLMDAVAAARARWRTRFVLTVDPRGLADLAKAGPSFMEQATVVRLAELPVAQLRARVERELAAICRDLPFDAELVEAALAPAEDPDGPGHPELACTRIELAAARARVRGDQRITVAHLRPEEHGPSPRSVQELTDRLGETIRGQDRVLGEVARRLMPPLMGLKARAERPHAVLLFTGPTGVGKTELAKQIARAVYGSDEALIRLDMSEYAEEADARMKLIGASRIWKNSSVEGLLTTRIRENPRSVLLLDEFEKSSPQVWPLFLQVFDEGRLTDGWGVTADFSETIIVMTTNLGVREASARAAGFGAREGLDAGKQAAAIARKLPPELLNRISATVRFDPLGPAAIAELAADELARLRRRLLGRGWSVDYTADVVDWIAATGYDPRFGARHLQRNLEHELLPLLAAAPGRSVRVSVASGALTVRPTGTENAPPPGHA